MSSETKESFLDIGHQVIKYANTKDIDATEVFFHQRKAIQVLTEGQSIATERLTSESGFAIRVLNKDVEGFSYTNKTDIKALESCVDEAVNIARVVPPTPGIRFTVPTDYPQITGRYTTSIADLTSEELIDNAKMVLHPLKEAKVSVRTNLSQIAVHEEAYGIINSLGVEGYSRSNCIKGLFLAVAREGDKVGSFVFDDFFAHESNQINFSEFGESLTTKAMQNLAAKTPPTIDSDVVVFSKNGVFEPLLYVIAHSIRADSVDQKRSMWMDHLADSVAVETFTLIDDSHNPSAGGGCRAFDDEGNPTCKTSIIKKGILETFLFDELRANKMETQSTGNSWRGLGGIKFLQPPSEIFPNAPVILPGDMETEEFYEDIKLGIQFEYFSGSVRPENGIFSGVAKGAQLIRNGELAEPLINVSIGGNIFDCLTNITGLSKETELTGGGFILAGGVSLTTPLIKTHGIKITTQK
ncbi:MAG: TldD/PmbA family protein [Promethearchaeota archaeon]